MHSDFIFLLISFHRIHQLLPILFNVLRVHVTTEMSFRPVVEKSLKNNDNFLFLVSGMVEKFNTKTETRERN